ncbi:MAG: hypothetical protein WC223_01050 [Bacteroidales bacterium]|jgi:hypothetical protein
MQKKSVFIFIEFFFLTFKICISQTIPIYENTSKGSQTIKYISSVKSESNIILNYFITKIAENISKPIQSSSFTLFFNEFIKVRQNNPYEYDISVEIKDFTLVGDYKYKGIKIYDALIPRKIALNLNISGRDGNDMKSIGFRHISLLKDKNFISDKIFFKDSLKNIELKFSIQDIDFSYDNENKKIFDNRLMLVKKYYDSEKKTNQLLKDIEAIDEKNIDLIPVNDMEVRSIKKKMDSLKEERFEEFLYLKDHDPIGFSAKLNDIEKRLTILLDKFDKLIKGLDEIYYRKGMENLIYNNNLSAYKYFQKSVVANSLYAPSNYQISFLDFVNNRKEDAYKKTLNILSKMSPDARLKVQTIKLMNIIFNKYISESEDLIKKEKYHDAVALLDSAEILFGNSTLISEKEKLSANLFIAKHGIYNSFMLFCKRAIETKNFDIAETYLLRAREFQQKNSKYITNDKEAVDLLKIVYDNHIEVGNKYISSSKFLRALDEFKSAAELCNNKSFICSEALAKGIADAKNGIYKEIISDAGNAIAKKDFLLAEILINRAKAYQQHNAIIVMQLSVVDSLVGLTMFQKYTRLIEDAKQLLLLDRKKEAFNNLVEAADMQGKYYYSKNKELDDLLKESAKPVIIEKINKAKFNIWANENNMARQLLNEAVLMKEKYKLNDDSTISTSIKEYNKFSRMQECVKIKNEYENNFSKIQYLLVQKKYLETDSLLANMLSSVNNISDCAVNTSKAEELKKQNIIPADYQRFLIKINEFIKKADYNKTYEVYEKMKDYYSHFSVNKYGLADIDLFDLVMKSNNNNFINNSANYYLSKKDFAKSLLLLRKLYQRDFPYAETKILQENLGRELALHDVESAKISDRKNKIMEYTQNAQYFDFLKESYNKNFRKNKNILTEIIHKK